MNTYRMDCLQFQKKSLEIFGKFKGAWVGRLKQKQSNDFREKKVAREQYKCGNFFLESDKDKFFVSV